MNDNGQFKIVFSKLQNMLMDEAREDRTRPTIDIQMTPEATLEELEQIEELRRIVMEVIDPEPLSFTTT